MSRFTRLREIQTFWSEFRTNFSTTGAVLPSSRFLARAITQSCKHAPANARILEAGPGTGAFTDALVRNLRPGDFLVLCELNDRFAQVLKHRLEEDPAWKTKSEQVEVRHCAVEAIDRSERFHAIVCGLPFNNFPPDLVQQLFGQLLLHLEPGGTFSFFEYAAIRSLKAPFVKHAERKRLQSVASVIGGYLKELDCQDTFVLRNVPPAIVHCLTQTQKDLQTSGTERR